MTGRASNRRGYALVLVLIFVVLFTAILGVAWRRVASALRVEYVSDVRKRCDKGSIQVLAEAMKVLETRVSCDSANGVRLNGVAVDSPVEFRKDLNGKRYKVTFTYSSDPAFSVTRATNWLVSATIVGEADCGALPELPDPL
jgi:hypothetical protein